MSNSLDRAAAFYIHSYVSKKVILPSRHEPVPGSNIRRVRAGALPFKTFKRARMYLLGHKEPKKGKPPAYDHKSPGGDLDIGVDDDPLDLCAIDGLKRELREEDFKGLYAPRNDSIVPVGVQYDTDNGVFQFYSVQLNQYPPMGTRRDAYFAREKEYETRVRWLTIDEVLNPNTPNGHDESIPYETAKAIAATFIYTKSRQIRFNGKEKLPVNPKGNIAVPDSIVKEVIRRTGLSWFPEEAFSECVVYYNSLKRLKMDPTIRNRLPEVQVFYLLGPFLHQAVLWEENVDEVTGGGSKEDLDRDCGSLDEAIAKKYVEGMFEEVIGRCSLINDYLLTP